MRSLIIFRARGRNEALEGGTYAFSAAHSTAHLVLCTFCPCMDNFTHRLGYDTCEIEFPLPFPVRRKVRCKIGEVAYLVRDIPLGCPSVEVIYFLFGVRIIHYC